MERTPYVVVYARVHFFALLLLLPDETGSQASTTGVNNGATLLTLY